MSQSILVVEDDAPVGEAVSARFRQLGWETQLAGTVADARNALAASIFDVVLVDVYLPDGTAFELVPDIQASSAHPSFIVVTGDRDTRVTVRAIREGAFDYLLKPIDFQELALLADRARTVSQSRRVFERQRTNIGGADALWGDDAKMVALRDKVRRLAAAGAGTLLVTGETGTGKQLVAQALHQEGDRARRPFVQVNVAAVPATLLESELFGYEKGAFTDARSPRRGLLEDADGGTLFLDEIGELDIQLQPKLLRLLEDRRFRRIGAGREIGVDIRLVAATNRNLDEAVREGRFRTDLLYRLDVARIEIPPLRARPADVVPLARRFLAALSVSYSSRQPVLSAAAEHALAAHAWPGNVRELRNTIERALFNVRGDVVTEDDLQLRRIAPPEREAAHAPATQPLVEDSSLEEAERRHILRVLEQVDGNKSEAARRLRISRTTLREKLRALGEAAPTGHEEKAES